MKKVVLLSSNLPHVIDQSKLLDNNTRLFIFISLVSKFLILQNKFLMYIEKLCAISDKFVSTYEVYDKGCTNGEGSKVSGVFRTDYVLECNSSYFNGIWSQ